MSIFKEKHSSFQYRDTHEMFLFAVNGFSCANCDLVRLFQVLDSGHRVPRHPLFFLGYKHEEVQRRVAVF